MRYAVLVCIALIAAPLLIRMQSPEPFPDAQSYEGLRKAELDSYDALYAKEYHRTMSDALFSTIPPQLVLILLATATYILISLFYGDELFLLLLGTTPAFVATFTTVKETALGVLIMAVMILLIKYKQPWAVLLIPVAFSLGFSTGIIATICCITTALIGRMQFVALGASFFALVSGIVFAIIQPQTDLGFIMPSIHHFLGIVGASKGLTIFIILLGTIGFLITWANKHAKQELLALIIIPCSLFFQEGSLVLAAFFAYYGSVALKYLWHRKWNFEELRAITLVLITCGILFTTIVLEKERLRVDTERVEAVRFIRATYPEKQTIAAPPEMSPILAYYGYPAAQARIPPDPSFVASELKNQGYHLIITKEKEPLYAHFPIIYKSKSEQGYTLYEIPDYQ